MLPADLSSNKSFRSQPAVADGAVYAGSLDGNLYAFSLSKGTHPPAPTPTPATTGGNGNPWGYDFNATGGHLIFSPPASFCSVGAFTCIGYFWNGHGYVVECVDGMYSKSGGIQGACSSHGGVWRALYSHSS